MILNRRDEFQSGNSRGFSTVYTKNYRFRKDLIHKFIREIFHTHLSKAASNTNVQQERRKS